MTTKLFTGYLPVIFTAVAFTLISITFAYASEVTGTLSSNALDTQATSGSLNGTVSDDTIAAINNGGSSGGSSRGSSNPASGSVLGASTDNLSAPAFPNAGFSPD